MKNLTLKALLLSIVATLSMSAQASNTYDQCIADGESLINLAVKEGSEAAQAFEQVTEVEACMAELSKIEAKYGDKTIARNPSSVMTPADRAKWAKLFDAIDAKKFKGVRYLQAVYYR